MKNSLWIAGCGICLFMEAVAAQSFPEGGAPLAPDALSGSVSGKVFAVKPAQGSVWRWQFDANGYFFINIGNFKDSGKWSAKDSALCTEGRQIKFSCNEVRMAGGSLYLKRDSGEVVKLEPQ
ncbi:MAG: hypothetical protein RLZZ126_1958 [Pseudomonadota bacterium]|jgi:hypothetical protein